MSAAARGEGVGDPGGGMSGLNLLGTPVPVTAVYFREPSRLGGGTSILQAHDLLDPHVVKGKLPAQD